MPWGMCSSSTHSASKAKQSGADNANDTMYHILCYKMHTQGMPDHTHTLITFTAAYLHFQWHSFYEGAYNLSVNQFIVQLCNFFSVRPCVPPSAPSVCLRFCAKFAVNLSAKTVQKLKVLIYNLQTFTLSMARCALLSLPLLDSLAPSLNCPLKCINIFYTILKLFLLLLSACLPTL